MEMKTFFERYAFYIQTICKNVYFWLNFKIKLSKFHANFENKYEFLRFKKIKKN